MSKFENDHRTLLESSAWERRRLTANTGGVAAANLREMQLYKMTGNPVHRNNIVVINLPGIFKLANHYAGKSRKLSLDDLIQEVTLGVMRGIENYDLSRNNGVWTYLYHAARGQIANCIRSLRNKNSTKNMESIEDVEIIDYHTSNNTEDIIDLRSRINRLLPKERKIIDLYFMKGYTLSQIAPAIGVTTKSRVQQLLNGIRHKLGDVTPLCNLQGCKNKT